MRCPVCDHVQKYREGMVCRGCGSHYANNPKTDALSDRRVDRAARRVGADHTRWYTVNQVVADIGRRRRLYLGLTRAGRWRRFITARDAVVHYATATGRLPGLIQQPGLDSTSPPRWPEPDLFDYGAERILVVDTPLMVDLLVRNGVHVTGRVAILSIDGYPAAVLPHARALVASRPEVPISVLHSSGTPGAEIIGRTRHLLGLTDRTVVFDLGLRPDAAKRLKTLRWARRLREIPADCLPFGYLTAGLVGAITGGPTLQAAQASDDGKDGLMLAWLASDIDFG